MITLEKDQLSIIAPLFRQHDFDTVILYTVLGGYHGNAVVDSIDKPQVARLDSGSFTILAGDPNHPAAEEIIKYKPIQFTTPPTSEWANLLEKVFSGNITELKFTECYAHSVKVKHLEDFINMIPSDYYIAPIDRMLAEKIAGDLDNDYFLEHFDSVNDFLIRGIGYCIVHNNQIVSAATSTAACKHAIDIEIKTHPDYQRTGLGTIIGASLVKGCLEQDIEPKWLAANDRSQRLAKKLGYTVGEEYVTFMIGD